MKAARMRDCVIDFLTTLMIMIMMHTLGVWFLFFFSFLTKYVWTTGSMYNVGNVLRLSTFEKLIPNHIMDDHFITSSTIISLSRSRLWPDHCTARVSPFVYHFPSRCHDAG